MLTNLEGVKALFTSIVKTLHMTPVSDCVSHVFPGSNGITAFQVIAESHISIHTWPEYNYFSFDVFSCKDFDDNALDALIHEAFPVAKKVRQIVHRGTLMMNETDLLEAPIVTPTSSTSL